MKIYRLEIYDEDEDDKRNYVHCYTTLEKAKEAFDRVVKQALNDVEEFAKENSFEVPEYNLSQAYFDIYFEEMGYFFYKAYINVEELDSENEFPIQDKDVNNIIQEEKRIQEFFWPGMEVIK